MNTRPLRAALLLVPSAAFVALYLPALDFELTWTDETAIGQRTMLRPQGEILRAFGEPLHRIEARSDAAFQGYYRPLQVAFLSGTEQAFGGEPRHFRAAGLAAGALCLAVFTGLAAALLGRLDLAVFAGLFAALHPVGIETYVWIAGASGALCALFSIAALALGLSSAKTPGPRGVAWGAASSLALLAGLLSKERAFIEPALLAVALLSAARLPGGERLSARRGVALVSVHAALACAVFLGPRSAALGGGPAALAPIGGSLASQWWTALASWPESLAWLFFPWHSSTSDVVRVVTGPGDAMVWLGVLLSLGSAAAWIALLRARPVAALGLAWIWIAWLPTAGLTPMLHARGERYLFLSSFGAALLLADLAPTLLARLGPGVRRPLGVALAIALLAFLTERTTARLPAWRSTPTLFTVDLAADPAFREAHFLLAAAHFDARRHAEADVHLATLLRGDPAFEGTSSYLNWVSTYELACENSLALGRHEDVLALEREIAREQPGLSGLPSLRVCGARARSALGRPGEAVAIYVEVAEELGDETPPLLYVIIARTYAQLGRRASVERWLGEAARAAPRDPSIVPRIERVRASLARLP